MHFPNPLRQVAHVTLKLRGSLLTKRVIGHASFPVASAMGPTRRELGMGLTSFNGKPSGKISLKVRVFELGVMVEDWVALGQGMHSIADAPAIRPGGLTPATVLALSNTKRRRGADPSFRQSAVRRMSSLFGTEITEDGARSRVNPLMNIPSLMRDSSVGSSEHDSPVGFGIAPDTKQPDPRQHRPSFYLNPMQQAIEASRQIAERQRDKQLQQHLGLTEDAPVDGYNDGMPESLMPVPFPTLPPPPVVTPGTKTDGSKGVTRVRLLRALSQKLASFRSPKPSQQ